MVAIDVWARFRAYTAPLVPGFKVEFRGALRQLMALSGHLKSALSANDPKRSGPADETENEASRVALVFRRGPSRPRGFSPPPG